MPILLSPDARNQLIRKDSDAGKDRRQEAKMMTEDEMAVWHHQLDMSLGKLLESWTGRSGVLRFMGWQRLGHDWVTELN